MHPLKRDVQLDPKNQNLTTAKTLIPPPFSATGLSPFQSFYGFQPLLLPELENVVSVRSSHSLVRLPSYFEEGRGLRYSGQLAALRGQPPGITLLPLVTGWDRRTACQLRTIPSVGYLASWLPGSWVLSYI